MATGNDVKRQHPRHTVDAFVDFEGRAAATQRVQNISVGGLCVHTPVTEEIGSVVELVVHFPEIDAHFSVEGQVVWVNADELGDMGIRFCDLDDRRRSLLAGYIERTLARRGR